MADMRVLVVEDEYDGQRLISEILHLLDVETDIAASGEEALQFLKDDHNHYAAIIVDLFLPGMDGVALLRQIRGVTEFENIPCVVTTAYHTSQVRKEAFDAGCDAYFPKPLNEQEFMQEISALLRN
jgi:CheY-like chemotaxis protein